MTGRAALLLAAALAVSVAASPRSGPASAQRATPESPAPESPTDPPAESAAEAEPPPADEPPLGIAAEIASREPEIELPAGAELRQSPLPGAAVELVLEQPQALPLVERAGGWARVRLGQRRLWVLLDGDAAPPAGRDADHAPPPAEPLAPDPRRMDRARRILGLGDQPAGHLGPWLLLTDVEDPRTLELFGAVAADLPAVYAERYGLEISEPRGAVLLFAREEDFRRYEAAETAVRDLGAMGHAGNTVAALFVERPALDSAPVLVHELTHLLNRQSLDRELPPWLEEGIASDMAFARIDRRGRLEPRVLGGSSLLREESRGARRRGGWALHLTGARASLSQLLQAIARRRTEPLAVLLDMPLSHFLEPERRTLRYIQSAFLVRYLVDGDRRLAPRFRAYLAAPGAAAARPPLADALGVSWRELEAGYAAWLRRIRL